MKNNEVTFVRIDSEINENLIDKKDDKKTEGSNKIEMIFNNALNDDIEASYSKDDYAAFLKKNPKAATILTPFIITKDDYTKIKPYEISASVIEELGEDAFNEIVQRAFIEIKTETKHLKSKDITAMIVFNEFMRRFQEMNMLNQPDNGMDMLKNHTLIVNPANETIKKILQLNEKGEMDKVKLLANHIHDLAMLEQKRFTGKELHAFIENANKVLEMIK